MYYANGKITGAIWDFGKPVKKLFFEGGTGFIDPDATPEHDPSEATGYVSAIDDWNDRVDVF